MVGRVRPGFVPAGAGAVFLIRNEGDDSGMESTEVICERIRSELVSLRKNETFNNSSSVAEAIDRSFEWLGTAEFRSEKIRRVRQGMVLSITHDGGPDKIDGAPSDGTVK